MAKLRVPLSFYFEHGFIEYYANNNEIYYRVKVWSKDGLHLSTVEDSKLNNKTPDQILQGLQMILKGMGK